MCNQLRKGLQLQLQTSDIFLRSTSQPMCLSTLVDALLQSCALLRASVLDKFGHFCNAVKNYNKNPNDNSNIIEDFLILFGSTFVMNLDDYSCNGILGEIGCKFTCGKCEDEIHFEKL